MGQLWPIFYMYQKQHDNFKAKVSLILFITVVLPVSLSDYLRCKDYQNLICMIYTIIIECHHLIDCGSSKEIHLVNSVAY